MKVNYLNPEGRADVMLGSLIEQGVKRLPNPIVRAIVEEVHGGLKNDIAADLKRAVGPHTRHGKALGQLAQSGKRIYRKLQERQS